MAAAFRPRPLMEMLMRLAAARAVALALFVVCASSVAASAQEARRPLYTNPVIAGDFPDPAVVRAGQDYWAATTTGAWAPHFSILHSRPSGVVTMLPWPGHCHSALSSRIGLRGCFSHGPRSFLARATPSA